MISGVASRNFPNLKGFKVWGFVCGVVDGFRFWVWTSGRLLEESVLSCLDLAAEQYLRAQG